MENIDTEELAKFSALAQTWWDPGGESRPLHELNPTRTAFVAERTQLRGARVLDVGCGGGILCESLARAGAIVTGIDANEELIDVARTHAAQQNLGTIDYECASLEAYNDSKFDVIVCMELLEHVPSPPHLIAECARRLDDAGDLFFSTINRTPKAYLQAVVGAEYLLRLLPQGTHDYARFIRPSELARWARANRLSLREVAGMHYNPFNGKVRLKPSVDVNYLAHFGFA